MFALIVKYSQTLPKLMICFSQSPMNREMFSYANSSRKGFVAITIRGINGLTLQPKQSSTKITMQDVFQSADLLMRNTVPLHCAGTAGCQPGSQGDSTDVFFDALENGEWGQHYILKKLMVHASSEHVYRSSPIV